MDLMAIINLNEMDDLVSELTHNRPLGAIPFAGRRQCRGAVGT